MAPHSRSKKRAPSFRRLLKTSDVKLENKQRNRQMKQQNAAKKQRKEQKRLRQALKGASYRPRPLDTCGKKPEEEEEEFLEHLPTDMIDEDHMNNMAASFITRDLSSCERGTRKRSGNTVPGYEKVPRKMARTAETEVVHLLPIKDRTGVIPQSLQRVIPSNDEEDGEEDEEHEEIVEDTESHADGTPVTPALREQMLQQKKELIASLSSAVISDPINNVKRVKELRALLMETTASVAVSVRKMAMLSLMEIFKDIAPTYRIRPLTSAEKATKVRKETRQLRDFEEGLLSQYKFYLEDLEQVVTDWKQQKKKRVQAVALASYGGLAEVAVRCLAELLVSLPHFNFHNNIIVTLVPLMNSNAAQVSRICCDAFRKLFQQDKAGTASLAAVRVVSGLIKNLNYNIKPEVLDTFLNLRIREADVKKDLQDTKPKTKFLTQKEKKKNFSRMQRKRSKNEEKLQKELLEAEASESAERKTKTQTEILNIVFLTYFRILKNSQRSVLLPAVLEGLAHFAHLINLEFFDDLLNVLQKLVQSGDLNDRQILLCIQTVFTILSGQGDVLNLDPLSFYTELYRMLPRLHAGATNDDIIIVLRCVDIMLSRRKKQVTTQRVLSFLKRLSTLSLHALPNASVAIMAASRTIMHAFPKCDVLLDNELQGSGRYLPELDQPEYCHAHNTALWELQTLQRHFHPAVRRLAAHLASGAPSDALLSRRSPLQLFEDLKVMTFDLPAAPRSCKKDHFVGGTRLLEAELQRQVDATLSENADLDFTHTL